MTMFGRKPFIYILCCLIAQCVQSGWAAENDGSSLAIEEVVVTARKKEESLQEIPLSIQAFGGQEIQRQGISTTEDMAKLVPGLQLRKTVGASSAAPDIRGLTSLRGRASVAILLDGTDITSDNVIGGGGGALLDLDLFNLERIEVVRGPQSALYGRNAFAGAISYTTKRPPIDPEGDLSIEASSDKTRKITLTYGGALWDEVLLGSIGLSKKVSDGAHVNSINGDKLGENDVDAIGFGLSFLPQDSNYEIDFKLSWSDQEQSQGAQLLLEPNSCLIRDDGPIEILPGTCVTTSTEAANIYSGELPDSIDDDQITLSDDEFLGTRNELLFSTMRIVWELDNGTSLTSITSYLDAETTDDTDLDVQEGGKNCTGILGDQCVASDSTNRHADFDFFRKVYFQELRWASAADSEIQWMLGLDYYLEKAEITEYANSSLLVAREELYEPGDTVVVNGVTYPVTTALSGTVDRDTTAISIFGSVAYFLTDDLKIEYSARYQEEEIEKSGEAINVRGNKGLGVPIGDKKDTLEGDAFNPRLTLNYTIDDEKIVYFSVARGTKPGGFTSSAGLEDINQWFDQEKLVNYELGTKTQWLDSRIQANAAIYYMDVEDKQVPAREDTLPYTDNAGKVEAYGFELDMMAILTQNLSMKLGYSYQISEFKEYDYIGALGVKFTPGIIDPVNGAELLFDENDPDIDLSGNTLPSVSKNSFNISFDYNFAMTDELDGNFNIGASYRSKNYVGIDNVAWFPARTIVDAKFTIEHESWETTFFVDNLTDETKPQYGYSFIDFTNINPATAIYAPTGRKGGVRFKYFF